MLIKKKKSETKLTIEHTAKFQIEMQSDYFTGNY